MNAPLPQSSSDTEREHHRLAAELAGIELQELVAPDHHDIVLNGLRLHYLDWGRDDGAPMLLLHGGGQTARTWDLTCLSLRDRYRCIALDQRGHGDSEWSYGFDYGSDAHARDFLALLDHLEIDRAIVVGMSMGCLNGLHFAAHHPERVAAFVAVDAGPWIQLQGGRRIAEFTRDAAEHCGPLEEWVERSMRFNPRRDPRLLRRSLIHNLRQLPDGTLTWKTDRRRSFDLERIEGHLETMRRLVPLITAPTLVLRGAESDVFTDADAERFTSALANGRWVKIPGAGHTVQGDRPAELVREIRRFLEELEAN